ncbi:MAG: hypothetical protein FWC72_01185, partial [Oscillospiraceae bacterium]|nr:hypothetical protein [Oscillospiraceae bacterium]
ADALEHVQMSLAHDRSNLFRSDSTLTVSPLRTNETGSIATLGVREQTAAGMPRIVLYLAQNVPGTQDVVRLEIGLYTDLLTIEDHMALSELSLLFGVNLAASIGELES